MTSDHEFKGLSGLADCFGCRTFGGCASSPVQTTCSGLHTLNYTQLYAFERGPLALHKRKGAFIVNFVIVQVYDLEALPVLFGELAHGFGSEGIVADVELLEFGPILLADLQGALVANVAVAQVQLLEIGPVSLHQIAYSLVIKQIAALVEAVLLRCREMRLGQSWDAMYCMLLAPKAL